MKSQTNLTLEDQSQLTLGKKKKNEPSTMGEKREKKDKPTRT